MKIVLFAVIPVINVSLVGVTNVGCGGKENESPPPVTEEKPTLNLGLNGDTYRDRRLFKIPNRPVNGWIAKEMGNAIRGDVDLTEPRQSDNEQFTPKRALNVYDTIPMRWRLFQISCYAKYAVTALLGTVKELKLI